MDHQEMLSDEMSIVLSQPSDMISNLPDNVIETILMHLPTRDAVRTSILSRKWRYRWAKLPQLILDETLWNKSNVKHSVRITVAVILCQLLLLHQGPIKKFALSIPGLGSCPEIDNLIFFLSRNGIEDLTLRMQTNECYRLPLSFSTCQQLRHLSLRSCLIETPQAFKGFSRLITLKLCEVTISAEVLGSLISSSPLLELLELQISSDIYDLEIYASNLKTFSFIGSLKSIILKKVPLLSSLSIILNGSADGKNNWEGVTCNLVEFFDGLPVLEYLGVGYNLVKSLAAGGVPRSLLTSLVYLKHLKLSNITLNEMDELSFTLCLVRNSPNLKHIDIQLFIQAASHTKAVQEFLKEQDYSDVMLNELKDVKLRNITGTIPELEFIKLLLAKSPSLEKLLVRPGKEIADNGCKILKELTRFRRASKEAEVIYADVVENQV